MYFSKICWMRTCKVPFANAAELLLLPYWWWPWVRPLFSMHFLYRAKGQTCVKLVRSALLMGWGWNSTPLLYFWILLWRENLTLYRELFMRYALMSKFLKYNLVFCFKPLNRKLQWRNCIFQTAFFFGHGTMDRNMCMLQTGFVFF